MICFDFPGGIGTASRIGRRAPRRRAAALQLRRSRVPRPARHAPRLQRPERRPRHGSCIAVCATDAPLHASAAAAAGAAAAARDWRAPAPTHGGLRRDRPRLHRPRARAPVRSAMPSSTPTSPPPTRRRTRPSTTASSPRDRRSASTGRCRRRSRSSSSRELAGRAMSELDLRDEVVELARALIRLDTSNPPGNETPAAELLAAYLERRRGRVRAGRPRSRRGSTWSPGSRERARGPR